MTSYQSRECSIISHTTIALLRAQMSGGWRRNRAIIKALDRQEERRLRVMRGEPAHPLNDKTVGHWHKWLVGA
jgi:hypothetical protein